MARPGGGHCSSPAHVDRHCGFAWREGRRQRATRLRAAQENPIPAADTLSQRASDAQPDDLQCVGTSLDVECAIPDGESGAPSTSQPSGSGLFEWAGPANGLLYAAFLVSPFFFWGTSMVTMKVSYCRGSIYRV